VCVIVDLLSIDNSGKSNPNVFSKKVHISEQKKYLPARCRPDFDFGLVGLLTDSPSHLVDCGNGLKLRGTRKDRRMEGRRWEVQWTAKIV